MVMLSEVLRYWVEIIGATDDGEVAPDGVVAVGGAVLLSPGVVPQTKPSLQGRGKAHNFII